MDSNSSEVIASNDLTPVRTGPTLSSRGPERVVKPFRMGT